MGLQEDFDAAAAEVTKYAIPNQTELLEVYALFKQATIGDVNEARPNILNLKGRAKWDAWEKKKGMSKEDAMKAYVALVTEIKGKCKLIEGK